MADVKPDRAVSEWRHRRHLPLAAVLVLFVVADVWMATVVRFPGDMTTAFVLGVAFAQVALLAVWTTFAPGRMLTRTLSGFGGTIFVGVALLATFGGGPGSWLFLPSVLVQWLVVQIPMWIVRLSFDWRICWPGEELIPASRRDVQFGIGQLMVWTALVGMTLGVFRLLVPEDWLTSNRNPPGVLITFTCLTVFNCLLAWPVVWSTLAPRRWPVWIVAASVCCIGLTYVEIETIQAISKRNGGGIEVLWIVNAIAAGASGLALLALRASGFRLVRSRIGGK